MWHKVSLSAKKDRPGQRYWRTWGRVQFYRQHDHGQIPLLKHPYLWGLALYTMLLDILRGDRNLIMPLLAGMLDGYAGTKHKTQVLFSKIMLAFVSITELSILDWSCKFLMSDGLSNKVFVLALDGATFDLIRPWAEQGKLPLFSKLMAESAWGELNSTITPITPVAWLTFMTGKNPGKHGVFNFFRPIRSDYAAVTPASATVNTESTLWELLSQRGRNVAILNVPMTYPPKPVNGSLFAGVPMPTGEMQFSYPPELHEELMSHGWDLRKNASFSQGTYEGFLDYLKELVVMRTDATLYLMKNRPWDFFMIHHFETDQVAHMYWRFMENEAESHPLHNAMLQLLQCVEEQMARIIQALPQRDVIAHAIRSWCRSCALSSTP